MFSLRLIFSHAKLWGYCLFSFILLVTLQLTKPLFAPPAKSSNNFEKVEIGLPTFGFVPVAYADFDNARKTDIVYLNENKDQIQVFSFISSIEKYKMIYKQELLGYKIVHVLPFDFNSAGYNDLLVSYSKTGNSPYNVAIIRNKNGVLSDILEDLGITTTVYPFAVNSFNFVPEVYYVPPGSSTAFKINSSKQKITTKVTNFESMAAGEFVKEKGINLAVKHENKVSLIDGNENVQNAFEIHPNAGDLYVADFSNQGDLDLMFPVYPESKKEKPFLCIMFNQNNAMQPFISDPTCSKKHSSMRVEVEGLTNESIISIGDLALNSRPDIIVSCKDTTKILLNQACRGCNGGETLFVDHSSLQGAGAVFDLYTDGSLDIVTDKGAYKGNLVKNEMFLAVSPLNGVCIQHCKKGPSNPSPQPLSTVVTGATTRLVYTDKSGMKTGVTGVTRATNHIEMPYTVIGLGSHIHYIQEVNVISAIRDTWTWVLPNSLIYTTKDHSIRTIIGYEVHGFGVLFAFTCLLAVLGFFVVYFSTEEDEEDKKEAEKMLPLF